MQLDGAWRDLRERLVLVGPYGRACMSAAFSPDGKRIVTASDDKTARLWDAETGKQIGEPLKGHTDSVMSAAFSPDGKRIVTASSGQDGAAVGRRDRQGDRRAAHGPYGYRVRARRSAPTASASSPRLMTRRRGCGTPRPASRSASRSKAMTDDVSSAAFSPDGKRIVTASEDKTARLWDAETGKPIGEPLDRPYGQRMERGVQPRRQAHRHRV